MADSFPVAARPMRNVHPVSRRSIGAVTELGCVIPRLETAAFPQFAGVVLDPATGAAPAGFPQPGAGRRGCRVARCDRPSLYELRRSVE
jgi:hypothetical protein